MLSSLNLEQEETNYANKLRRTMKKNKTSKMLGNNKGQFTAAIPFLGVMFLFVALSIVGLLIAIVLSPKDVAPGKVATINQQSLIQEIIKLNPANISVASRLDNKLLDVQITAEPYTTLAQIMNLYGKGKIGFRRLSYAGNTIDELNVDENYLSTTTAAMPLPNVIIAIRLQSDIKQWDYARSAEMSLQ